MPAQRKRGEGTGPKFRSRARRGTERVCLVRAGVLGDTMEAGVRPKEGVGDQ